MANTTKNKTDLDANQVLQTIFNDVNATISTDGFITGKVGHKVTMALSTTTQANDTETYTFTDNGTTLHVIKVIYTSTDRDVLLSCERTA